MSDDGFRPVDILVFNVTRRDCRDTDSAVQSASAPSPPDRHASAAAASADEPPEPPHDVLAEDGVADDDNAIERQANPFQDDGSEASQAIPLSTERKK